MAVGDVGLLVWVGVVVLGVISSIVSAARRRPKTPAGPGRGAVQRQAPPYNAPSAPRRDELAGQLASALQTRTATAAPLTSRILDLHAETPFARPAGASRTSTNSLFGDRSSLIHGIVAAQVLGKPGGLSDEY